MNATETTTTETFHVGDRVTVAVNGQLATVTETDQHGAILAALGDDDRTYTHQYERFHRVLEPYVGMPCSITLVTDTSPAVVTKVNKKSVTVRRVPVGPSRHVDYCQCATCTGTESGALPVTVADGLTDQPIGEPERFTRIREGRYRNGTIGLRLGVSARLVDYRM